MKKIGFYTRHKLEKYSLALASEIGTKFNVFVFSEDNLHDSRILNTEVYFNFSGFKIDFSDLEIQDIIYRCRVLRCLDYGLAFFLVRRASAAVCGMIYHNSPDVIVAPRIDDYFLDILKRVCDRRGIKFIGLWRSAFQKGKFFLTSRGEYTKVSSPSIEETNELIRFISNDNFKGTSISFLKLYKIHAFIRFFKLFIRAFILEFIRNFSANKFRYRELATRFFVNEYKVNLSDVIYSVDRFMPNFDKFLQRTNPRIFFALQVNPESTIDYYCTNLNLINVPQVFPLIVKLFVASGYDVIIKDHPNMIGNRRKNLFEGLNEVDSVFIAPSSMDSKFLIKNSDITFTWSGTVAVQAIMMKRKSICVCVPYYIQIKGFYRITSLEELRILLASVELRDDSISSDCEIFSLANHILSSHLPGDIYTHNNQPLGNYKDVADFLINYIGNK